MTLIGFDSMTRFTDRVSPEWGTLFTVSTTGRDGVANGAAGPRNSEIRTWSPPGGVTLATCFVGFAATHVRGLLLGSGAWSGMIRFMIGATVHCVVGVNGSGMIEARRSAYNGTLLATSSGHPAITLNAWNHYQVKYVAHTSAGLVEVKLNGQTVLSFTGQTATADGAITALSIGSTHTSGNDDNIYYDDWWVADGVDATATQGRPNNGYLGNLKVATLLPNAPGDSSAFTPSTAVANWTTVDELAPVTTDYVGSAVVGARDLYHLVDLPSSAQTVFGVRQRYYAAASDSGSKSMKSAMKLPDGTVLLGPDIVLNTTMSERADAMRMVKAAATPFTVADVNGLQSGVEVSA